MNSIIFDLIILDIMMPGKTGLQFLKEIRKNSRVPILMLTAMSSTEDSCLLYTSPSPRDY